jgi:GH25 family lysozyme M1 (1,4-beta-N-acetylmuramidase)
MKGLKMNKLEILNKNQVSEKMQSIFAEIEKAYGKVPNLYAVAANSEEVFEAFLNFAKTI